jgi:hypothetical protein
MHTTSARGSNWGGWPSPNRSGAGAAMRTVVGRRLREVDVS